MIWRARAHLGGKEIARAYGGSAAESIELVLAWAGPQMVAQLERSIPRDPRGAHVTHPLVVEVEEQPPGAAMTTIGAPVELRP